MDNCFIRKTQVRVLALISEYRGGDSGGLIHVYSL